MKSFGLIFWNLVLLVLIINNNIYCQWADISLKNSKETIYGFHFLTPDTGFAVGWSTSKALLLKTTNSGENWTSEEFYGMYFFDVVALDTSRIYLVGYSSRCMCGLILSTSDNGKNWVRDEFDGSDKDHVLSFGFFSIEQIGSDTMIVVGYDGAILKTINGGKRWYPTISNKSNEVFKLIRFPDKKTGYAFSGTNESKINRIYKTENTGETWKLISDLTDSAVNIKDAFFVTPAIGFIFGNQGGSEAIFKSEDYGITWNKIYLGKQVNSLSGGVFTDLYQGYAIGESSNILITTDGGDFWFNDFSSTAKQLKTIYTIKNSAKGRVYIGGADGTIIKKDITMDVINDFQADKSTIQVINSGSNFIQIILPDELISKDASLVIFNIFGQKIIAEKIFNKYNQVVVNDLMSGVYFYQILITSKIIQTGKFLINK